MIRQISIILPLLLIGCQNITPISEINDPLPSQSGTDVLAKQETGVILHDSEAPILFNETENLIPEEKLSDTGLLKIGDEDAPLTLLIFTEHHCAYCKDFHNEQLPPLIADYVLTGKLQIHIGLFTLDKYLNSTNAAKSAYCSAAQEKGLAMQTLLFEHSNNSKYSLISYAKELEIDEEIFDECFESEETETIIASQKEWAQSMGVKYIPTFFLNGEKLVGLQYYADLQGRIDHLLQY